MATEYVPLDVVDVHLASVSTRLAVRCLGMYDVLCRLAQSHMRSDIVSVRPHQLHTRLDTRHHRLAQVPHRVVTVEL